MRMLALVLALLAPLPAFALSCLPPSVARSYTRYAEAPETYFVFHGQMSLDEAALPKGETQSTADRMTPVPGRLSGKTLSAKGFAHPFEQDITLEVGCIGPWCAVAQDGMEVLAFVRRDADGYAVELGPCGGAVFAQPTKEQLGAVQSCFRNRGCGQE